MHQTRWSAGHINFSVDPGLYALMKSVPLVGYALGTVSTSLVSGASAYAVGKIFNRHFAEGGTFLTFDPEGAIEFYAEMRKEGEKVAAELNLTRRNKQLPKLKISQEDNNHVF